MSDLTSAFSRTQKLLFFLPIFVLSLACSAFKSSGKSSRSHKKAATEALQLRQDVSGWAQNYVGIKYHYAGTKPATGFDCSGFTSHVFKEFDVKITSSSAGQSNLGVKVPIKSAQPGDLIFFSHANGRGIQHVALCVSNDDGQLVVCHSTNTRGVVVENVYESDYWRKRVLFARDVISPRFLDGVKGER